MLKRLFYASASILMLAIAYHLGATTAAAQAPGNPVAAYGIGPDNDPFANVAVTANGDVYGATSVNGTWVHGPNVFGGAPPTSPVVGYGLGLPFNYRFVVVTAAGDVYGASTPGSQWTHVANVFGGSTPAQRETWGALKGAYRK
jgi:hypothetical protein